LIAVGVVDSFEEKAAVRRWTTNVGLGILVLLLASQLVPVSRSNPPIDPSGTIYSTQQVPPEVKAVLDQSCKNCHSDETAWPWYSYVAPLSWVIARDVHQGRKAMNFSQWGTYPPSKRERKLEDICDQLANGDMPDRKYILFHQSARVSESQRSAICDWTENAREY
jgi:hypothetical protein